MVRLKLPLKHYDEGGRVIPPVAMWLCLAFLARAYIVFLGSLTIPRHSELMLKLFYPAKQDMYIGFITGIGALLIAVSCSFRDKIREAGFSAIYVAFKPLLLMTLLADLVSQLITASNQYWAFSWSIAITLCLNLYALYWLISSRYLVIMIQDWLADSENRPEK
mgnify:CR=1 FL=1